MKHCCRLSTPSRLRSARNGSGKAARSPSPRPGHDTLLVPRRVAIVRPGAPGRDAGARSGSDDVRSASFTSTAAAAIVRVLDGGPIQAMVSPSGQVVLVARSFTRRAGLVRGPLRDVTAETPVGGARGELVGTRYGTVSRD